MADQDQIEDNEGVNVSSPDTPEQDVTPAADDGPASMAEAVEAAFKEQEGASSDPASEVEDGEEPVPGSQSDDPDGEKTPTDGKSADGSADQSEELPEGDPTDEEMQNYSHKANSRIRSLVEQRNEAAARAQRVEPILDFMEKQDIPQQDLDVILDLTARLRHGDFAGFLQGVTPYVNLAMQYTGQALPADLQQQVQQGYVSPEIAKELAQRRAEVHVEKDRSQKAQRASQVQQAQMRGETIRGAITEWERGVRQSDPDYDLKADMIRRTSQALMQEHGVPMTPEDAVSLAKAAYDEVNGQMGRIRPAPKATARTPASTGQGGSATATEPSSMMEAAMLGLEQARRA
jgi:hypothetical protein